MGPADGPRIYLSQACHNRGGPSCQPNFGCDGYDENAGSAAIARAAAGHFAARGYRVRIGDGLTEANIQSSNDFGALIHIPIHSNAGAQACGGSDGGTQVLHFGGPADDQLAGIMVQEVGSLSPGTGDMSVVRTDLGEITETKARVAYLGPPSTRSHRTSSSSEIQTPGPEGSPTRSTAAWVGTTGRRNARGNRAPQTGNRTPQTHLVSRHAGWQLGA
ncbi:MAG TPA: hypothetical protein VGO80_05260 [Solirubrobacteraceae bacterium]|nr:hypothetical protein [Solirubrobacteraceae bacterium]